MCYSALVRRWTEKESGLPISVREQNDDYRKASEADPKRFPPIKHRIYPAAYAPVIHKNEKGEFVSELMRYGAYPPHHIPNPSAYTTFNARRDNLMSPFWSVAFMKHHGFVALEAFYEWVAVKDLLKAGVVSLSDIKEEFAKQAQERKQKILDSSKKYKPTPTELKDPRMRKIVIEFKPDDNKLLMVPVIFSLSKDEGFDRTKDKGFAIVTDEPTPEIQNAGHDRSPVILERDQILRWLEPLSMSPENFSAMLINEKRITFRHKLAEAA